MKLVTYQQFLRLSVRQTFSTLATAIETASLVDTFDGEGNFTVFARRMQLLKRCLMVS